MMEELWSVLDPAQGENLRYTELYDAIRQGRAEDEDLPMGVWKRPLKTAQWSEVQRLCLDALEKKTKDFQIFFWLGESLIMGKKMAGLCQSLELCKKFTQLYGDIAYPSERDDDSFSPLWEWADKAWVRRAHSLPIGHQEGEDVFYNFGHWTYGQARVLESQKHKHPENFLQAEMGNLRWDEMKNLVGETPKNFYQGWKADIEKSMALCESIQSWVKEKWDMNVFTRMTSFLSLMDRHVQSWIDMKATPQPSMAVKKEKNPSSPAPSFVISSYEDACLLLESVMRFLRSQKP